MKKHQLLFISLLIILSFRTAIADMTILPFTKDSYSQIKSQNKDKAFILIFWSETCSYCMKELAMFGKLYKQYPDITLVTVATDPFLEDETVKRVLSRSQLDLQKTWVFAEQFPERIYYKVNKSWRGELPATHFFGKDNKETRHMGIVKEEELVDWMNKQSAD
jgi:thiol-disulfide isomerase/thioredoxin